jgi:uncharacterized protein
MHQTPGTPDTPAVGPLSPAERLPFLDAVRGLAILGVLLSFTLWNLGSPPPETWTATDRAIDLAAELLVDTKFISLFAFLFGAGTARQWRRFERAGSSPAGPHLRRMLFLLAVGLIHGALLRNGDILGPYALLGLLLLMARGQSAARLLTAAAVLLVLPLVVQLVLRGAGWTLPPRPGAGAGNLDWLWYWYQTNPLLSWPRILALMLLGVLADRARLLERLTADARFAWWVLTAGLVLAVSTRLFHTYMMSGSSALTLSRSFTAQTVYHLSAWSLAAAYAAALALVCHAPTRAAQLGWLRAVGRTAFTNYLLQALLVVPLCLSLDLFDHVTPTLGLVLAAAVAAVQIPFSVWWLHRFPFGPVEWAWRTVTYRQPTSPSCPR